MMDQYVRATGQTEAWWKECLRDAREETGRGQRHSDRRGESVHVIKVCYLNNENEKIEARLYRWLEQDRIHVLVRQKQL